MIRVVELHKSYGQHQVLKGLNLEIQTGETVVILGRSGTGKSVLLKQILGIEQPDAGEIYLDTTCLTCLKENERYLAMRQMGMLFQGAALFDSMTVGENVSFYLRQHLSIKEKELLMRAEQALEMVGLKDTAHLMPSDLSGGMRKRAALARLIVYRPTVLLYDEPTTGLDPITAMQINDLIVHIQKELNATSIVVTHDLCSAFHVADRIALNHEGKILYVTKKEDFCKIEDPLIQSFLKNSIPNGFNNDG